METLETALQEIDSIPAYLPNCLQLQDVITRAKDWLNEAEALQVTRISPGSDFQVEMPQTLSSIFFKYLKEASLMHCYGTHKSSREKPRLLRGADDTAKPCPRCMNTLTMCPYGI